MKAVAALSQRNPGGRFGGQFVATCAENKQVRDVTALPTTTLFPPPHVLMFDLIGYWNITEWAALRVGVFNATDEKYWWWSDVRGLSAYVTQTFPPPTKSRRTRRTTPTPSPAATTPPR